MNHFVVVMSEHEPTTIKDVVEELRTSSETDIKLNGGIKMILYYDIENVILTVCVGNA